LSKATQNPRGIETEILVTNDLSNPTTFAIETSRKESIQLIEKRLKIHYGDIGYSFESVFSKYLIGASAISLEDPYVRQKHQITNFLRFCELLVKIGDCRKLTLITGVDDEVQKQENILAFDQIADNLFEHDIEFRVQFSETLHDRELQLNNCWNIKMGRGLDYFQSLGGNYFQVGTTDLDLRPCLETSFDFYRTSTYE